MAFGFRTLWLLAAVLVLLGASPPYVVTEAREACASRDPQRNVFFGDLHVHTVLSQDASTQGTRNTPRDAYRFARGQSLGLQPYDDQGQPLRRLQLDRPLDFAAVTDHAEMLGETHICRTRGLRGYKSWVCRMYRGYPRLAFFVMNTKTSMRHESRFDFCGKDGIRCLQAALTPWDQIQDAAEGAYDRSVACRFTAFVAYEWTAAVNTNNLHRNVIFRNEKVPGLPPSVYEAGDAVALWDAIERGCLHRGDGCDAVVIPHNSNLSNGLMFQTLKSDGSAISAADARRRQRLERLVEVMQHKGDSECRLGGDAVDEACGFEKLSFANFIQKFVPILREEPDPRSFTRDALGAGLQEAERLGVNPFQFGLIASTDTHLGTPGAVAEDRYPGHGGAGAPASDALPRGLPDDVEFNPGGLAAIWAEENARDALFASMGRREVYGTSGPRLVVRFFGGWDYPADLCDQSLVSVGYERGVPMGGDLPPRAGDAPVFAVSALRDPGSVRRRGTALQRIQIIKGWVENGASRARVYEVAGDPYNEASVDPLTCEPQGTGADSLCAVWRDPDFDAGQHAYYYARVLENPSCRWSTWVCNAQGVRCSQDDPPSAGFEACCDPSVPRTIQERAWTSPIWYSPAPVAQTR